MISFCVQDIIADLSPKPVIMNKRWPLFFLCFLIFYGLLHLAYDMPNIIHGSPRFMTGLASARGSTLLIADISSSFLFAFLPYLILFHFYPRKKIGQAILCILLALPVLFFMRYWADEMLMIRERASLSLPSVRLRTYFYNHLFYIIVYAVYGMVFYFIRYAYFNEMRQKDLLLQNRESELSFLRSQINPHFLFNSLNNIYSLVYLQSPNSLEAIAGFSDLLRYMLYDTLQDVPLEKEAHYIRQYIDLQKLRFEAPVKAGFQTSGPLAAVFIPPLLLIPFVENAFKHGTVDEDIVITLDTDKQQTRFYCQNRKMTGKKDSTGGIGLQNVQRRLELLYPGKHRLSVMDGPVFFIIKLEIDHA